jgi:hypothetical protein
LEIPECGFVLWRCWLWLMSSAYAQTAPGPGNARSAGFAVCWAATGLNTAYYSAPFRSAIDNRYAWIPAFAGYLEQNHGYRGFVTCKTKLASLPHAQGYLAMLIENSRGARLSDGSPQNYVETGWRYARSASAMDFLYH